MKDRFFEITSREGKIAYIPVRQLLRIEAIPRAGIFLNFSETFQVNVGIANAEEAAVAKSLCNELTAASTAPVRLNPDTPHVIDIHF